MWCHLCKINFTVFEDFKCHIMEKHRPKSIYYEVSDSEESEKEEVEKSLENPDTDVHYEHNAVNSEDDTLSSDSSPSEHSPKTSSPKPSTSNCSQENKCGFRKSHRIKKPTFKIKSYYSLEESDSEKEENLKNAKTSEPAVNNQINVMNSKVNETLGQQPLYIINPLCSDTSQLNSNVMFELNSKNILNWLTKHKELCNNLQYPLPPQLYKKVKMIYKKLLTHYCLASPSEENKAILKVCEDLNTMILSHIACIHDEL